MSVKANQGVLTAKLDVEASTDSANSMDDRSGDDWEFGGADFDDFLQQSPAAGNDEDNSLEADAEGETIIEENAGEPELAEEEEDSAETPAEAEIEEQATKPNGAQARIDELTRQSKEAIEALAARDTRLAELEAKLAERQAEPASNAEDPFSDVEDLVGIDAARERLLKSIEFAMENLEGFTANEGTAQEREYSAAEVRKWHSKLTRQLHQDLPKRVETVRQMAQYDELGRTAYPNLYKAGTAEHGAYLAARSQIPGLSRLPNAKLVVGDALVGQLVRTGQLKVVPATAAKPAKPAAPAATAAKPATAPAGVKRGRTAAPSDRQKADAAAAKLERSEGGVDDLADFISASGILG